MNINKVHGKKILNRIILQEILLQDINITELVNKLNITRINFASNYCILQHINIIIIYKNGITKFTYLTNTYLKLKFYQKRSLRIYI